MTCRKCGADFECGAGAALASEEIELRCPLCQCPGCGIELSEREQARGWCDDCEKEKHDHEDSFAGGG